MQKVLAAYRTDKNDTGFADFFTKTGLCNHVVIDPTGPEHIHDTARLTLDYDFDLELFRRIFEALYRDGEVFGLDAVVDVLNRNPDWLDLNSHINEEYWQRHGEKSDLQFEDSDGTVKQVVS